MSNEMRQTNGHMLAQRTLSEDRKSCWLRAEEASPAGSTLHICSRAGQFTGGDRGVPRVVHSRAGQGRASTCSVWTGRACGAARPGALLAREPSYPGGTGDCRQHAPPSPGSLSIATLYKVTPPPPRSSEKGGKPVSQPRHRKEYQGPQKAGGSAPPPPPSLSQGCPQPFPLPRPLSRPVSAGYFLLPCCT